MIIGFTGTRQGMTESQTSIVEGILKYWQQRGVTIEVVHGDCVGADADFDHICAKLSIPRSIRPCTFMNMRAWTNLKGAQVKAEPERPMARNRAIVADADFMIACPPNTERIKKGSGTWATIGFTEKANKPLVIVYPGEGDGATTPALAISNCAAPYDIDVMDIFMDAPGFSIQRT